ncbi:hypothetical protein [Pseudonocardia sp. NPDC049154]|uniref:hypothetical protein n=1 Tax=Pseudonocardia sp. NPDC049154 TaxID=3155501 RepID=UPI0033C5EAC3
MAGAVDDQVIEPGVEIRLGLTAMVLFTSREAADSFRTNVGRNHQGRADHGIELIEIRVLEVTATAIS